MPSFEELGAPRAIASVLARAGITSPTPIQTETVAAALAGRDVSGRAPTGSGKTLAFSIPLAARVADARPRRPRGLVLTPTRELAAQIEKELRPLLATRQRTVASFYGGVGFGTQLKALRRGVDVAVACPGRLADLVQRGEIDLGDVEIVVIDEADRMADMGFLPEVRRLLDQVRDDRQTLLFSATLDGDVDVLVRNYQRDAHVADVMPADEAPDRTTHSFLEIDRNARTEAVARLIAEHGPTVVFCRTRHGADRLAKRLSRDGSSAVAIHGGRSQNQRDRALADFAKGRATALVATDVAARGIHVDDVACVIHYDFPGDSKDYVHRSGRTGRAGARGLVVTLVTDQDRKAARALRSELGIDGAPLVPRHAGEAPAQPRPAQPRPARKRRRNHRPGGQAGSHDHGREGNRNRPPKQNRNRNRNRNRSRKGAPTR